MRVAVVDTAELQPALAVRVAVVAVEIRPEQMQRLAQPIRAAVVVVENSQLEWAVQAVQE
jgi:hypothetical protein